MSGGGGDNDIDETPQERELAKVMTEKYGLAQDHVKPLIRKYEARVRQDEGDYDEAAGRAAEGVRSAFGDARSEAMETQRQAGAMPGSGRAVMTDADISSREGASIAGRQAGAANDVTDLHYRGLENVLQMYSGKPVEAQRGMTEVAGRASGEAIADARNAYATNAARSQAYGTVAGAGVRGAMGMNTAPQSNPAADWQARDMTLNQGEYMFSAQP